MKEPTPNKRAHKIINLFQVGILPEVKALRELEACNVRGSFDRHGTFRGYDHGRQQNIEVHFSRIAVEG